MSSIITSEELTTYIGKSLDAGIANLLVAGVNQYIETTTSRVWGDTKTITERYDWGHTLWLRHQDVTAIANIKVGWPGQPQQTLDPTGYFFNSYGRVTMLWQQLGQPTLSPMYHDYLEVTYTYGSTTVPDDLKQAALAIASRAYSRSTQAEQDAILQRVGSYELRFQQAQPQARPAFGTPDAVVASYATRRV